MISPQQRRDKLVRATDLDALSCRNSTNERGYFIPADRFIGTLVQAYQEKLPNCQGYTRILANRTLRQVFLEPKLPLINRGTYFRTKSIDIVLGEFVEQHKGRCQIVSLGSGSDTRAFRTLEQHPTVVYHEIDFPESAGIKKAAIMASSELQLLVGSGITDAQDANGLHTDKYHLYGYDLRELAAGKADVFSTYVDTQLPTLVISECVLCYLSPEDNERVVKYWMSRFAGKNTTLGFLVYEPMSLNDSFGRTMVTNLQGRGITLPTFEKFPTIESKQHFYSGLGLTDIKVTDLSVISGYESSSTWITSQELVRINLLEMIDEIEEIRLLLKHYCLVYAGVGEKLQSSRW